MKKLAGIVAVVVLAMVLLVTQTESAMEALINFDFALACEKCMATAKNFDFALACEKCMRTINDSVGNLS